MPIADHEETHLRWRRIVPSLLLWRRRRIPSLWRGRVVIPAERRRTIAALALVTWVVGHSVVVLSSISKKTRFEFEIVFLLDRGIAKSLSGDSGEAEAGAGYPPQLKGKSTGKIRYRRDNVSAVQLNSIKVLTVREKRS